LSAHSGLGYPARRARAQRGVSRAPAGNHLPVAPPPGGWESSTVATNDPSAFLGRFESPVRFARASTSSACSGEVYPPFLPVTRGLDPRVHLPLPTLPRKRRRVGRGMDCRVKPGNDVEQNVSETRSKIPTGSGLGAPYQIKA